MSDAELILMAYERWGADAASRMLGDFAFVIWDPREHRVMCSRDATGQRALYYWQKGGTFLAATEIAQLLAHPAVPLEPNDNRIREYLTPYWQARNDPQLPETFFAGISAVQAGHTLIVDDGRVRSASHWNPSMVRDVRYRSNREYAEHFANLLADAVTVRLRSAYPVAATLSGGLDSASIVCLAQSLYQLGVVKNHGFSSFTLTFEEPECDETMYVRDVVAKYAFDAQFIHASDMSMLFEPAPQMLMSGPGLAIGPLDAMLRSASALGARVMLAGASADSCFPWSWHFLGSLLRRGKFGEYWRFAHRYRSVSGMSMRRLVAIESLLPLLPVLVQRPIRTALASRELSRNHDALIPKWITPEVRADLLQRHTAQTLESERSRIFSDDSLHDMWRAFVPVESLPIVTPSPVTLAQPFSDRRVREYVLGVPPEQIFEPHPYSDEFYASHKLLLRRGLRSILPESIRMRTEKTLFTPFVLNDTRRRWSAYETAFGPGAQSEIDAHGYVDGKLFWDRLVQMRDGGFGDDGQFVSRALNTETWLRSLRLDRHEQPSLRLSREIPHDL
jgi:asparagine synthase (glutamine-hydrolysing)